MLEEAFVRSGRETLEVDVLIIAPSDDSHASAVAAALRRRRLTATIFDSSRLPATAGMTFAIGCDTDCLRLRTSEDGSDADVAVRRSIWWRRPRRPQIDDAIAEKRVRRFCELESNTFFRGSLAAATGIPVVNDPMAEWAAEHKPLQLAAARQAGLRVPRTVMTNDPVAIRALYEETDGQCVYKTFRPPSWRMVETRQLRREDLHALDSLRHAPIIAQELIRTGRDIRVTVVGTEIIAAEVTPSMAEAALDWRLDLAAIWRTHDLPADVSRRVESAVGSLGLHYGCVDLRQDPDGEYVFFEVNPAGQFLFVEIDTARPILDAFVTLLRDPSANRPASLA
jgi:glutathione synthase/RimK-type ligase-like ATP-grasp enzyme